MQTREDIFCDDCGAEFTVEADSATIKHCVACGEPLIDEPWDKDDFDLEDFDD